MKTRVAAGMLPAALTFSSGFHAMICARLFSIWLLALAICAGVNSIALVETTCAETASVQFNESIRPILVKHCAACHGGPKQAAGVSFLHRDLAMAEGDSGLFPLVPGKPDESYLLERVIDTDDESRMPPPEHGPRLTDEEVALLREWIKQGAKWQEHWSLVPPAPQALPEVKQSDWANMPLDRFVLARLEQEKLEPSPPASRSAWLRRVTFDLVGLPPSEQERFDFLADESEQAFERVVDRLLASPHFGERWASMWLDLARYADTMGFEKDPHRNIWPYRDWVIRAFNADMPYDQFTIKQLAGDLFLDGTIDDRLATAFHRNTQTNTEGGTDDEEFRVAAVIDRVNTTWQVWQATTFGCAQCHDHPYDAFKQKEYYQFAALFNTSRDGDTPEEFPRLAVPLDEENYEKASQLDQQIKQLKQEIHGLLFELAEQSDWQPLTLDQVNSTGNTKLEFVGGELQAGGTITAKSRYTLEGPVPKIDQPITALRIDAFPIDLELAARNAEAGFVLSRLKLWVIEPGQSPKEVFFAYAVCDEPEPTFDPMQTLRDNSNGWGEYPRLYGPRVAVFVLDEPLTLAAGSRLKFSLKHEKELDGAGPLVIRRARFSISTRPDWHKGSSPRSVARLAELEKERAAIKSLNVPVMQEREADFRRRSFLFERGNWLAKGEEVWPATPASMKPLRNGKVSTRLDLAHWIASPQNPLTSRAMVNRLWAQLFGTGIVETVEDIGASGETPSHPQLLDHLALRFSNTHAWSLKPMLRELVLSATYRQDAKVSPELLKRDPNNRLLARGPRQRLTAEMLRDQALVLSGKFEPKMYGPPVMPPQPAGVWQSVYSQAKWKTSEGSDRYRRAIYTYWKRTSPYPSLMSFDMSSREVCTLRRIETNTPLQALVTLNDPAYVELAQGLAQRMAQQGDEPKQQIEWAYRQATGETIPPETLTVFATLYENAEERYTDHPDDSKSLADSAASYARTIVASTLMNLDATLTR